MQQKMSSETHSRPITSIHNITRLSAFEKVKNPFIFSPEYYIVKIKISKSSGVQNFHLLTNAFLMDGFENGVHAVGRNTAQCTLSATFVDDFGITFAL